MPCHIIRMLVAVTLFVGALCSGSAQAEPPVIPRGDGAPGENEVPRFAVEPAGPAGQVFLQAPPGIGLAPGDSTADAADDGSKLDDLDKRAPVRRNRQVVWEKAAAAVASGKWDDAFKFLDQWHALAEADSRGDSLVRHADGSLGSGRLETARLLQTLPSELRRKREEQVGGRAQSQLDAALQSGGLSSLSQVASRYFGTRAGYAAANRLATRLVDAGDFALAARWLLLLRDAKAPLAANLAWKKRTRLVLAITGLDRGAEDTPNENVTDDALDGIADALITSEPQSVREWLLPGGNAARHARTPGGEPVLIPTWTVSTVSSTQLQSSIDEMIEALTLGRSASVPVAAPICVDGRIISRTFHGIDVVDAITGQRLWSTSERSSVERLLESSSVKQGRRLIVDGPAFPLFGEGGVDEVAGVAAGPLSQFVFQNAAQGLISSDGRRVFYVEDDPMLTLGRTSMRNGQGLDESPEPGSGTANRLVACDIQTGRIAWQVGGPASDDPFGNTLRGLFFMGAPLPAGDDLFVVAMQGRDVRLYCIDRNTGEARWSQLLAFADHQPDRDLVRRIWSAQPTVAHGVVVCPTSTGWLVAVDRSTGTLLWAHRYAAKKRPLLTPSFNLFGENGLTSIASEPVNSRWVASAPIIAGRRVFVTPPESRDEHDPASGLIVCLDLFTGQRIWKKPRGKGRYLAGVSHDRAIVVENNAVVAYGLKGKPEWDVDLPREVGAPSGRGVITGDSLWLPTQKSGLLRIDLTEGTIADQLTLPDASRPLGNLAMYRGMLISHHPAELQAFEQTTELEQRLATVRARDPRDPTTAVLDARLAIARGEFERAMTVLKNALTTSSAPVIRSQLRSLLAQAILKNLEKAPAASLSLVRELGRLDESNEETVRHRQLAIEVLLRTGHPDEALQALLELDAAQTHLPISMINDPRVTTSMIAWMEERLATAWSQLPEAGRDAAAAAIAVRLNDARASHAERKHRARLFAFHPAAAALQVRLADLAVQQNQFAEADHWLARLANSRNPELAAPAVTQQIELGLRNFIDDSDLRRTIERAEALATHESPAGLLNTRLPKLRAAFEEQRTDYRSAEESRWSSSTQLHVALTRFGGLHTKPAVFGIDPVNGDSPAGSRYRIQISRAGNARRLSLIERATGELAWSVVLRGNSGGRYLGVRRAGSLLLVLNRGVLNCLSIPDRRVLWTRAVDMPESPSKFPRIKAVKLESGDDWNSTLTAGVNDPLPAVNERFVCSRGRKSLTVLDTLTGELLWQVDPAPRTVRVHATQSMVFLVRRNGQVASCFDARSGRPIEDAPEEQQLPLARMGDQVVSAVTDEAAEAVTIESRHPGAEAPRWNYQYPVDHAFGIVGDTLAIMRDRGRLAVLDLTSGTLQEFDRIPASLRIGKPNFSVLRDERRWYVILSGDTERDYQAPSVRSALISGHLIAFDAGTGKMLWKQSLSSQYLILDQFASSPFLIALSPSSNLLAVPSESLRVLLINKHDGSSLLDESLPGLISVHSMRLDPRNGFAELFSQSDRIRLTIKAAEAVDEGP